MSLVEHVAFGTTEQHWLRMPDCQAKRVPAAPKWFLRYLERGFHLINYPQRQKGPSGRDAVAWQTKPLTRPEQYVPDRNWGVLLGVEIAPGRFLADVDFDWQPGVVLARYLLVDTGFAWGRGAIRVTHGLYTVAEPLPSRKYEDIDGTTLAEFRCLTKNGDIGMQSLMNGIHPNGERIELRSDDEIAHVPDLARRVTLYAVACIVLRHIGPRGLRHDVRLALAGVLLRAGLTEQETIDVGCALTAATGNDTTDVAPTVRTTEEKIAKGDRIAGRGALAAALGERGRDVVRKICEYLGLDTELQRAIDPLNERFAVVSVENKVVVMQNGPDGGIEQLWSFEEFRRLHVKDRIAIGRKTRSVADVWLEHEDGRQYQRLVYAMPGSVGRLRDGDYNGWLGFRVQPAPGDWSRNREHIRRILCGNNETTNHWLLNWMAALVQMPGRHAMTAVVLRGGQGTGKGHFANLMLGALFHKQQYLHILGASMLTGRFNEHLSGKVLVFADESTWGGDPVAAEKLKGMITESTIPIERKFLPLVEEPSALHIVIASNNEWPISIPMDDRRFLVLDVQESERQNDAYFGPLRAELQEGGLAAMLHDLLAWPIDEHLLRHPPTTEAKQEVMAASLRPIERWWYEKLVRGSLDVTVTTHDGEGHESTVHVEGWRTEIRKDALHDDYMDFLSRHGDNRARRSTETELGTFLAKHTGLKRGQRRLIEGERPRFWALPPLDACRAFWAAKCNWPEDFDWAGEA